MNSKLHYADICEVPQEVLCMGEAKATFKQMSVAWPFAMCSFAFCSSFEAGTCLMCLTPWAAEFLLKAVGGKIHWRWNRVGSPGVWLSVQWC